MPLMLPIDTVVYCCLLGALEKTTVLPSDFKTRVIDLKNKYYPVEVDPKLTIEEKCPHMVEW